MRSASKKRSSISGQSVPKLVLRSAFVEALMDFVGSFSKPGLIISVWSNVGVVYYD